MVQLPQYSCSCPRMPVRRLWIAQSIASPIRFGWSIGYLLGTCWSRLYFCKSCRTFIASSILIILEFNLPYLRVRAFESNGVPFRLQPHLRTLHKMQHLHGLLAVKIGVRVWGFATYPPPILLLLRVSARFACTHSLHTSEQCPHRVIMNSVIGSSRPHSLHFFVSIIKMFCKIFLCS